MVFFASTLMGATLEDVSYSIKQNGIMVNLDYTEPIDDDDIIGWKSDRGWVYLTLLGVRAPKGKKPQQDFSGEVRKIVIDDFDESTQLAILIRKPILGYDIINSKTSPSTIVFIHTEMKKSEVATLKEYIKEKGTSVFNVAQSSGFPKYNTNFKNAFDEARKELGPNAIFEYHGKLYTTNHPGEKETFSKSVLTEKPNSIAGKGENNSPTANDILDLSSENIPVEETYVDIDTGDTLTEEIANSLTVDYVHEKSKDKKDDSWFSGLFPAKKNIERDSTLSRLTTKKDTLIIKEKPIMVETLSKKPKSKRWSNFFNFLKKRETDNDEIKIQIVENDLNKADSINRKNEILTQEQYKLLQERYIPAKDQLSAQSTSNRQGRGDLITGDQADEVLKILKDDATRTYDNYEKMLNERYDGTTINEGKAGLARELARMNLTLNSYTQWYWKTDLLNLLNFLFLRADSHAQYEIRVYAEAMLDTVKKWVPITHAAFLDYRVGAVHVSAKGKKVIQLMAKGDKVSHESSGLSKREWNELMNSFGFTEKIV